MVIDGVADGAFLVRHLCAIEKDDFRELIASGFKIIDMAADGLRIGGDGDAHACAQHHRKGIQRNSGVAERKTRNDMTAVGDRLQKPLLFGFR